MDDLNILLQAQLDEDKSVSNIDQQIKNIQEKLKNINITLNIDDFKNSIATVLDEVTKQTQKISNTKLSFASLSQTVNQIKSLKGDLDSVYNQLQKIGNIKKVSQIFDNQGNIKGFKVDIEEIKNGLSTISTFNVFAKMNKDTGEVEYALTRINNKIQELKKTTENTSKTNDNITPKLSKLEQNLNSYTANYKAKLSDVKEYIQQMESAIYKKDGTEKQSFANLPEAVRLEYLKKLQTAHQKDAQDELNKQTKINSLQNQYYQILKKSKDYNKDNTGNVANEINSIEKLTYGTEAYYNQVNKATQAVQNLKTIVNQGFTNNNPAQATKALQSQLEQVTTKYGRYVDINELNNIQNLINNIKEGKLTSDELNKSIESVSNNISLLGTNAQSALSKAKQGLDVLNLQNKADKLASMGGIDSASLKHLNELIDRTKSATYGTEEYRMALKAARAEIANLGAQAKTFNTLKSALKFAGQLFGITSAISVAKQTMSSMISTVNELNSQMTEIRMVTGDTYESVVQLRDGYTALGKAIGATTAQVMSAAIEYTRQGRTLAETQQLLQATIMGSNISGLESSQMTEYLTSAVNGYNVAAMDAITVVDKLVAIDNASASSFAELSVAMSRTAKSAQLAGVDMNTLLGYIGTIESVTRKSAETIGESLKAMFSRYQNLKLGELTEDGVVASDVRKALALVNIELMATEDTFRDFDDVIDELAGKWGNLSQVEKSAVAQAMAGVRQRENFLVLMDNMSQAHDLESKALSSEGLAMNRYSLYLESTEAKLNTLKATLEGVFTTTLDSDTINNVIELATVVLQLVDNLGGLANILPIITSSFMAWKNIGRRKIYRSLKICRSILVQ